MTRAGDKVNTGGRIRIVKKKKSIVKTNGNKNVFICNK